MHILLTLSLLQGPFSDVPQDHWAAGALGTLKTAGLVRGYPADQTEDPQLGKTDAQILAMGQDSWFRMASAKWGDSTMAMVNANGVWLDVLTRRNDALLAKLSTTEAARLRNLRNNLRRVANAFTSIGSGLTGGGTMWSVQGSNSIAVAEAVIAAQLGSTPVTVPKTIPTPAKVDAAFARAKRTIDANRRQIEANRQASNMTYASAVSEWSTARSRWSTAIRPVLPTLKPAARNLALAFVADQASLQAASPN